MSSTILFKLTFIFIYSTFSKNFSISTKVVFILTSNHLWKCFSVNAGVWLRMENGFSGKEFQLTVKLRPLTQKIFSAKILPSNHFQRRAKREREREKGLTCANRKRERSRTQKTQDHRTTGELHRKPMNPRSSHREPTNREPHRADCTGESHRKPISLRIRYRSRSRSDLKFL